MKHKTSQPFELEHRILKILAEQPEISQRQLATKLNLSLGKVNFCLQALGEKGFIKMQNLLNSNNKWAYLYVLTPKGIEEKARLTYYFLQRKMAEYDELEKEISQLQKEVEQLSGNF